MYIKILSNDNSHTWGGTLRPEKVTPGKIYEVLEVREMRGYKAYAIRPDDSMFVGSWWIYEEDENGKSLRHHFVVLSNLMFDLPVIGV